MSQRAVILSAVRTPVGRYGGALAGIRPDDLAALAVARRGRPRRRPRRPRSKTSGSAARTRPARTIATSRAWPCCSPGLPDSVGGVTVNRLCASGLAAIVGACHAVIAGDGDLFVAGGVESMTRAPLVHRQAGCRRSRAATGTLYDTTLGWRFPNPRLEERFPLEAMGETGENVAERWDVSRRGQDAFALRSQQRWAAAAEAGRFDDELVPVGDLVRDEHPRPDTSAEKLAALRPAFRPRGTVTAGNSSGLNDGAAALVVASEDKARELGIDPLGAFVGSAVAGVDPRVMGIGPVPAVRKLLARTGVDGRRPRPGRAERGVRVAVARGRARARPRRGPGERQRRRDRDRPPARDERRSADRHAAARAAPPRTAGTVSPRCASASARARPAPGVPDYQERGAAAGATRPSATSSSVFGSASMSTVSSTRTTARSNYRRRSTPRKPSMRRNSPPTAMHSPPSSTTAGCATKCTVARPYARARRRGDLLRRRDRALLRRAPAMTPISVYEAAHARARRAPTRRRLALRASSGVAQPATSSTARVAVAVLQMLLPVLSGRPRLVDLPAGEQVDARAGAATSRGGRSTTTSAICAAASS